MVKFMLILIALLSFAMGGVFLIIPEWFITLSDAESVNVAWLRNVGASLVTLQGFGLAVASFRRRDTNPLLAVVALASTVQSGALWYSLVAGEFSAEAIWAIVVPSIVATAAAVALWAAWISRRRSLADRGAGGSPPASHEASPPEAGPPPGD